MGNVTVAPRTDRCPIARARGHLPATGRRIRAGSVVAVTSAAGGDDQYLRRRSAAVEAIVGGSGAVAVALAGWYFAFRPASGTVDGWFLSAVPGSPGSAFWSVTSLRQPWVVVAASAVLCLLTVTRDLPRALACLSGPPLALVLCELVAKPAVGRTLGGSYSFPSGSTTGAAALACAAVLAAPAAWRWWVVGVSTLFAIWMGVAVVALRWHYPTDAFFGLVLGVAVVLLVDSAAWWLGEVIRSRA